MGFIPGRNLLEIAIFAFAILLACASAGAQCTPPPDGTPCDDGNACTVSDVYISGICTGGSSVACDDGAPSTLDFCDPDIQCIFATPTVGSGNFSDPGIWSGGVAPGSGRSILINAGHTVDLDIDTTVPAMIVDTGATLNGGAGRTLTISPGGKMLVQGNFNAQTGNVIFAGTGFTPSFIECNQLTTFNNLAIATDHIVTEVSLTGNILTSGTFDNQGRLRYRVLSPGLGNIEFGLTGVTMNVTVEGCIQSIQVDRVDKSHAFALARQDTGVFWAITASGSSYSANVTFPIPQPISQANATISRYLGSGNWDTQHDSTGAGTVTRNNVSAFSDWAVGDATMVPVALTRFGLE